MKRHDLAELHYIAAFENVPLILTHGILCRVRAARLLQQDVSDPQVQKIRAAKNVPNGLNLHRYANVYVNGRNKMLWKVLTTHSNVCLLRISCDILDLPGAVIADENAASNYVYFDSSPRGLRLINRERVFAESWKHANQIDEWKHGSEVCAEVLVPDSIPPSMIVGAHVADETKSARLRVLCPNLPIQVSPYLFFRGAR
ncbi:MAG: DarT ssDNA thymidine ADP-ribosyltransferase family protein [Fimbriimonas sp.]